MEFKGKVGRTRRTRSFAHCEAKCDKLPKCLAFNYGNGTCEYMYNVTGINAPVPGFIAAWRGFWEGGAPSGGGYSNGSFPSNQTTSSSPTSNTNVSSPSPTPSTNTTTLPGNEPTTSPTTTSSLNTTVSGFPSITANTTDNPVGPTGVFPAGYNPTGSYPSGFPSPSGYPGNETYPSCDQSSCEETGVAYCTDSQGQLYSLNCGVQFNGNASSSLSSDSLDACQVQCDSIPLCLAFNFDGQTCSFLARVTGITYPAPGWTAAWRGFWAGGAPPGSNFTNSTIPAENGTNTTTTSAPTNTTSVPTTSPTDAVPTTNSTSQPGPTNSTSSVFPTGAIPTGQPSNDSYPSCAFANCGTNGTTYCNDNNSNIWTLNCGAIFLGNITSSVNATEGLVGCGDMCDLSPRCIAFNYNGAQCDFLGSVTGIQFPAPGQIGAWKG
jgi:hypothetical protein